MITTRKNAVFRFSLKPPARKKNSYFKLNIQRVNSILLHILYFSKGSRCLHLFRFNLVWNWMFVAATYIYVSASFNFLHRDQFSSNGEITIRDCSLKESRFLLGTFFSRLTLRDYCSYVVYVYVIQGKKSVNTQWASIFYSETPILSVYFLNFE